MDELSTNSASNEEITSNIAAPGKPNLKRERSSESSSDAEDLCHKRKRHRGGYPREERIELSTDEYTVGWVCALPLEMAAARGMLDRIHPDLSEQDPHDHNGYILGHIQGHNVVIACLPAGIYGTTPAATVSRDMLRTFKSIRFGMLVGIGGGVPSPEHDIRLGDIVVSQPNGKHGGVIQYDRGKTLPGHFERTGSLNAPPQVLLSALSRLQAEHMARESKIPRFLSELVIRAPQKMKKKFDYQGSSNDDLFEAEGGHMRKSLRNPRDDTDPVIHYGTIASGNLLIKDGKTRDRLSKDLEGVLCFEMEAAGLQDFPCLVVRGICDYADSHKNKTWQEYAAATAAAFAKELLSVVPPQQVLKDKPIQLIEKILLEQNNRQEKEKQAKCHQTFKTSEYESTKNLIPDRSPGTCKWVLEHSRYKKWQQSPHDDLLWISADPGCGKSVLAKSIIDKELEINDQHAVLYFFFKDSHDKNDLATALCALLHQLFHDQPPLLRHAMSAFDEDGEELRKESDKLWRILIAATNDQTKSVTCILDALDECRVQDRKRLLRLLTEFHENRAPSTNKSPLKFLVTGRPYLDVELEFKSVLEPQSIRLAGEGRNADITKEIDLFIKEEVFKLGRLLDLSLQDQDALQSTLLAVQHQTYLWVDLVLRMVRDSLEWLEEAISGGFKSLPKTVEDAYEKILSRIVDRPETARILLLIVVGAQRPLTLSELDVAFHIATDSPNTKTHKKIKVDGYRFENRIRKLCGLFIFVKDDQIHLIHQTAKEFLVAKGGPSCAVDGQWKHSFDIQRSHTILTRVCVQYLSITDIKDDLPSAAKGEADVETHNNRLLQYAAEFWPAHLRNATSDDAQLLERIFGLYKTYDRQFQGWFAMFRESKRWFNPKVSITNIHLAALHGHDKVLERLLNLDQTAINIPDNEGRTPLTWGCLEGHEKTVQMLLDKGADFNLQSSYHNGDALYTASMWGQEKIVQILLNKGTHVNAESGIFGNAICVATARGHEKVVELLFSKGADIKPQDHNDNALCVAATIGNKRMIKMLLDLGADINTRGGHHGNVICAASRQGNENIVRMLLDNGADVNPQEGFYGNALCAATEGNHERIVQMLLNHGADVNAPGGYHGNALSAAMRLGHRKIERMLIDNGADINKQSGIDYSFLPMIPPVQLQFRPEIYREESFSFY